MNKKEFLNRMSSYEGAFKGWKIETDRRNMSDFVLGCYYDPDQRKWNVYINKGNGRHCVVSSEDSQSDALDRIYGIMDFRGSSPDLPV